MHKREVTELTLDNFEEGASALLASTVSLSALVSGFLYYKWAGLVSEQSLCSTIHGWLIILYLHLSHWELRRGNLKSVSTITGFQRQTRIIPDSSCLMAEFEQITYSCSYFKRCNMSHPSGKHGDWGLPHACQELCHVKCAHGERTPWRSNRRWLNLPSNYFDEASACREIHKWKTNSVDFFRNLLSVSVGDQSRIIKNI